MTRVKTVHSKVYSSPRRPYEKELLDQVCLHEIFPLANRSFFQELKLIGEFGLKSKREVWRVKYTLAKISVSTTSWRGVCRLRLVNRFLETLFASFLF